MEQLVNPPLSPQAGPYCVNIPGFEGPFDLLYQLVLQEKVEIWDISIAHIVDQYMRHITLLQELQFDMAGEFLLMASSLMRLKSRLLLPRLPTAPGEREEEAFYFGSKEDLVRSLLAFRRFKQLAAKLQGREKAQQGIFLRNPHIKKIITVNMQPSLFPYSRENLQIALTALQNRRAAEKRKIDLPETISFRSVLHRILTALRKTGGAVRFLHEFLYAQNKRERIMAIFVFLELARRGRLKLHQEKIFGRIRIIFSGSNRNNQR